MKTKNPCLIISILNILTSYMKSNTEKRKDFWQYFIEYIK